MKSFLTGSRRYGTPHPDSDIDLVVLMDGPELTELAKLASNSDDFGSPGGPQYEDGFSLRFGNLNLLCVTQEKHFKVWKQGTDELVAKKPVTRDEAILHLAQLRHQNKIEGW